MAERIPNSAGQPGAAFYKGEESDRRARIWKKYRESGFDPQVLIDGGLIEVVDD